MQARSNKYSYCGYKGSLLLYLSTQVLKFFAGFWEHIICNNWISMLYQVFCHRISHVTQPNESNRGFGSHCPRTH